MEGWKLLVVQPLLSDGRTPDGDPVWWSTPWGREQATW